MLEHTAEALFSGDFEAYLAVTALPFRTESFDGIVTLDTVDDLRAAFDAVRRDLSRNGVTDLSRNVLAAEFNGPDEIRYSYTTRMLSGTILLERDYPNLAILRRIDGQWKLSSAQHAITGAAEHTTQADAPAPQNRRPPAKDDD